MGVYILTFIKMLWKIESKYRCYLKVGYYENKITVNHDENIFGYEDIVGEVMDVCGDNYLNIDLVFWKNMNFQYLKKGFIISVMFLFFSNFLYPIKIYYFSIFFFVISLVVKRDKVKFMDVIIFFFISPFLFIRFLSYVYCKFC